MLETLKRIPQSFYSQTFYRDMIRSRTGFGGWFVMILIVLLCVQTMFALQTPARKVLGIIPAFLGAMPEITLHEGTLSIDKPSPYTIMFDPADPLSRSIVFDTTITTDDADALRKTMEQQRAFILITANKAVTLSAKSVSIDDLKTLEVDTKVTRTHWESLAHTASSIIYPTMAVVALISALFGTMLRIFIGGLFVLLLSLLIGTKINYETGVRIATITAIPCTIFMLVAPLHGGTYYALWALYISFALWAGKMLASPPAEKA
jgi:hypothetical protein